MISSLAAVLQTILSDLQGRSAGTPRHRSALEPLIRIVNQRARTMMQGARHQCLPPGHHRRHRLPAPPPPRRDWHCPWLRLPPWSPAPFHHNPVRDAPVGSSTARPGSLTCGIHREPQHMPTPNRSTDMQLPSALASPRLCLLNGHVSHAAFPTDIKKTCNLLPAHHLIVLPRGLPRLCRQRCGGGKQSHNRHSGRSSPRTHV